MLPEDEVKLRELIGQYSPRFLLEKLANIALEAASDCSDNGLKEQSKELTALSVSLDTLISGKLYCL